MRSGRTTNCFFVSYSCILFRFARRTKCPRKYLIKSPRRGYPGRDVDGVSGTIRDRRPYYCRIKPFSHGPSVSRKDDGKNRQRTHTIITQKYIKKIFDGSLPTAGRRWRLPVGLVSRAADLSPDSRSDDR